MHAGKRRNRSHPPPTYREGSNETRWGYVLCRDCEEKKKGNHASIACCVFCTAGDLLHGKFVATLLNPCIIGGFLHIWFNFNANRLLSFRRKSPFAPQFRLRRHRAPYRPPALFDVCDCDESGARRMASYDFFYSLFSFITWKKMFWFVVVCIVVVGCYYLIARLLHTLHNVNVFTELCTHARVLLNAIDCARCYQAINWILWW